MNINIKYWIFLLFIILTFYSCDVINAIDETTKKAPVGNSFIELKDGNIVKGTKISFPTQPQFDPFKRIPAKEEWDTWIGIDGRKIDKPLIFGYQENGVYKTFYNNIWITRLKNGRMNLYFYETDASSFGNGMLMQPNFVYEKGKGNFSLIVEEMEKFYTALEDNPNAATLCKKHFPYMKLGPPGIAKHKILDVVDTYNK